MPFTSVALRKELDLVAMFWLTENAMPIIVL